MKKNFFALMGLTCLVFTSCSKDKEEKDPLIGEWVAEKVVSGGKDLGIDNCTKQTRASISEKQFNYYVFYNNHGQCLSDNGARLRISQTNENYVILHRK